MILPIITFLLIFFAIERGINYKLPNYIRPIDFGIVGFIYTLPRVVAPRLMFMSVPTQHIKLFLWGVALYIFAFLFKKAVWRFIY